MARTLNMTTSILLVVAFLGASVFYSTDAASYTVGDTTGWQTPTSDSSFYSSWASAHTFNVGDTLVFNFATGVHTVANVTQDVYNSCNAANALSVTTTGPATITLTTTGTHYYMCTINNHCSSGQKLAVTVGSSSSSPSPPSTGNTTSPPPPPPPPKSGSSSLLASFSLVFLSIAVGYMCY